MAKPAGYLIVPVGYNPDGRIRALELDADDRLIVNDDQIKTVLDQFTFDASDRLIITDTQLKTILDKLTFDASGYLKTIEQATPNKDAQMYGHYDGAWQKQPLMPGISAAFSSWKTNLSLAAAGFYMAADAVPAGEMHTVSAANIRHNGATVTRLIIIANVDGNRIYLRDVTSPAVGAWYLVTGSFLLGPGDYMEFKIEGATIGDDLYGLHIGMRTDIDL